MEELLYITYKDKTYTLEELIADNNDFAKRMVSFKPNSPNQEILYSQDIGYYIANRKVHQLYDLFSNAKFSLINAHKKLHKSSIEWRSGNLGQLWLRSQYLRNAIIWYNSCIDYVYQIVWFAFDFYGKLDSKQHYENELFNCKWDKLEQVFKKNNANSNIKELCSIINAAKSDKNVRQVNKWANNLKHKANIYFKELQEDDFFTVQFADKLSSEDLYGELLDLDDTCLVVQNAHIKINELIIQIINFIDFDSICIKDEEDNFRLGLRDKKEFKKIVNVIR